MAEIQKHNLRNQHITSAMHDQEMRTGPRGVRRATEQNCHPSSPRQYLGVAEEFIGDGAGWECTCVGEELVGANVSSDEQRGAGASHCGVAWMATVNRGDRLI